MKHPVRKAAAFSLVELTLAIGVAAFCFVAVLGLLAVGLKTQQASIQQTTATQVMSDMATDLRAAVRYPPGQQDKLDDPYKTLKGHWATVGTPDTLYYTNEGVQTGGISPGGPPADAIFRAVLTYYAPPMPEYTTSLASITVSWPAQVDPADPATGTLAGSVSTFIATNR